jgi:hypothetical protein
VLAPVQPLQQPGRVAGPPRDVAEVPDLVPRPDRRIPVRGQRAIHFGDVGKRALADVEHAVVAEMGVAGEEDHAARAASSMAPATASVAV